MIRQLDYGMFPDIAPYGNFVDDLPEMSNKLLTELLLQVFAGLIGITALAVTAVTNSHELNFGTLIVLSCMAMYPSLGTFTELLVLDGTHRDRCFDLAINGRNMEESGLQRSARELYEVRLEHYYKRWVCIAALGYSLLCILAVTFTTATDF